MHDALAENISHWRQLPIVLPGGKLVGIAKKACLGPNSQVGTDYFVCFQATEDKVVISSQEMPAGLFGPTAALSFCPINRTRVCVIAPQEVENNWHEAINQAYIIDFSNGIAQWLNISHNLESTWLRDIDLSLPADDPRKISRVKFAALSLDSLINQDVFLFSQVVTQEKSGRCGSRVLAWSGQVEKNSLKPNSILSISWRPDLIDQDEGIHIVGKIGEKTLLAHIKDNNLLAISLVNFEKDDPTNPTIKQQIIRLNLALTTAAHTFTSLAYLPFELIYEQGYLKIYQKNGLGKLIGQIQVAGCFKTKKLELIPANQRKISLALEQDELEHPWQLAGNDEPILIDEETTFFFIPGTGVVIDKKDIPQAKDLLADYYSNVLSAKYGEANTPELFTSWYEQAGQTADFAGMLKIMEQYGVFFVPWNLVGQEEDANFISPLNMAFQVLRLISAYKPKRCYHVFPSHPT